MKKNLLFTVKTTFLAIGIVCFSQFSFGQLGDNLMTNPGFEDGVWAMKLLKGDGIKAVATIEQDADNAHSGTYAGKVVITEPTPKPNKVTMFSDTIKSIDLGQYYLSAYVKTDPSDSNGYFKLSIQQDDNDPNIKPVYPGGTDISGVTSEYQLVRGYVTPRPGFLERTNIRGQFDATVGTIYVDDFTFQKVLDMPNTGFEDSEDYFHAWSLDTTQKDGAMASISQEVTDVNSGSSAVKIDVSAVSDTASQIGLASVYTHFLESGGANNFSYSAKAANDGDSIWVIVKCFHYDDVQSKYVYAYDIADSVALSTEYTEYVTSFSIVDSISYVKYKINLGNQVGTYYFDDFSAKPYTPAAITSSPVETATVGEEYSYQVTYEGSGEFSVSSYPEASWLSIDQNGLLTGTPTEAGEFGVSVILDDGITEATQSYTLTVSGGQTSVSSLNASNVKVFPNPASDYINISNAQGAYLNIYDMTGKVIVEKAINSDNMSVNIAMLNRGLYVISLQNKDERIIRKLNVK